MGSSLFSIKAELQDIILQLEEGEATEEIVAKLGITEDNLKEAAYHRKVRIRAIKRGGTIVEGTILETKSKYPINVFENESSKKVSK